MTNSSEPLRDPSTWIRAEEVLRRATRRVGSVKIAKRLLEKALQVDAVAATCSVLITEVDFGLIRHIAPHPDDKFVLSYTEDRSDRLVLGGEFWSSSTRSMFDNELFKWKIGVFACVYLNIAEIKVEERDIRRYWIRPPIRTVAYEVSFSKPEILSIVNSMPADVIRRELKKSVSLNKRRHLTDWNWQEILAEFTALAEQGLLEDQYGPFDRRGVQAAIEQAVKERCSSLYDCEPSLSTLRRRVKALMEVQKQVTPSTEPTRTNLAFSGRRPA